MYENILVLYENGMITSINWEEAIDFCRESKIGNHKCCVETRYGWCCDICLEDELLMLYSHGVHTINSCCGHGDFGLASILTVGDESEQKMREFGYSLADDVKRMTDAGKVIKSWVPKSVLIYNNIETRKTVKV